MAGQATAEVCQSCPKSGQLDPNNAINLTGTDGGWGMGCWEHSRPSGGPAVSLVREKPCRTSQNKKASGSHGVHICIISNQLQSWVRREADQVPGLGEKEKALKSVSVVTVGLE